MTVIIAMVITIMAPTRTVVSVSAVVVARAIVSVSVVVTAVVINSA